MSQSVKRKGTFVTLKVSDRISVNVTPFNGQIYFHIRDNFKGKSLSLAYKELKSLMKQKASLFEIKEKIEKKSAKKGKKKKKNFKKSSDADDSSSAAEDVEMTSSDDGADD